MKTNCLSSFTELKRLRQTVEWELQFRSQVQDWERAIRMQKLLVWIDGKIWGWPATNTLITDK